MLSPMPLYWVWILSKILSFSENALMFPFAKWNLRLLQGHWKEPALGGWSFSYTRQTEGSGEMVNRLLAPDCFFPLMSLTNDITASHWDLWPCLIFDLPHYCHRLNFWSLLFKFMGVWPLASYRLVLHPDFCQNLQGFRKVNMLLSVVASWLLAFFYITTGASLCSISMTPLKRGKMKTLITIWIV